MRIVWMQAAKAWGTDVIVASWVVAALGLSVGSAWAVEAFPLDRQYKLGEEAGENGTVGELVGVDFDGKFFTFDSVGVPTTTEPFQPGSFQDLERFGDPRYADVSDRPLYSGGVGVEFDGSGDFLRGDNLNLPSTSRASIGYDDDPGTTPANFPGPNNYNGISNRFFQFWVEPDATDAANPDKTQSLVMDSNQHGVQIVDGNWSMRYRGTDHDSGISVASTVDSNGWAHVMLARPFGTAGGSRLYINGEAVAAAPGGYTGGAHEELILGSNTSRDGDNEFDGGTQDFYHGLMDDLTMTLVGNNTGNVGPPQGVIDHEFNFFADNEFAADYLNGFDVADLNRDNNVDDLDVTLFVAGWYVTYEVNGVQVGDINSQAGGDINADGFTNLDDAFILHEALITAGGVGLDFSLLGVVPEPASAVLLLVGVAAIGMMRIKKREIVIPLILCPLAALTIAPAHADTISINLYNNAGAPETNQVGASDVAGIVPVSGWNNIGFEGGVADQSTGTLGVNDSGGAAAATFQSTLTTGFVGFNTAQTGFQAPPSPNRDFMTSYLSWDDPDGSPPDDIGNLSVSGLGTAYTSSGYNVVVYFDPDRNDRTHTITVGGQMVVGSNLSTFDGLFKEAAGEGVDANYAVFSDITASSFTIDMSSSSGRGAVNALQITTDPVPDPHPVLTVDRGTGAMALSNGTATDIDLLGYSITSEFEALDQAGWTTVTGNYDAIPANGGTGDGSVDMDDKWIVLSASGTHTNLSEFELEGGDGGTIAAGGTSVNFGTGVWVQNPNEDVDMELKAPDGTTVRVLVEFTGNGGNAFAAADLDFDGDISSSDWVIFNANHATDLSGLSPAQAYQKGDLDGDIDNDFDDYLDFKTAFEAANGPGSFDAMTAGVPEPGTWVLLAMGGFALLITKKKRVTNGLRGLSLVLAVWGVSFAPFSASAETININLWKGDAGTPENNTVDVGEMAGVVPIDGVHWNNIDILPVTVAPTSVKDDQGNASAATFQSTLQSAFIGFSGAVGQIPTDTGDRSMMASYISWDDPNDGDNPNDLGELMVTGLDSSFTTLGYDVYLYADTDANNRTFEITVTPDGGAGGTLNVIDSATFSGTFHESGTGTDENYVLFQDLTADAFTIDMRSTPGRGAINGIQIVSNTFVVPELTLLVNTATGATTLSNDTGESVVIDYYRITSDSGSLDPNGWNSLEDQDFEGGGDPGNGDGWEEAGGVNSTQLIESYLGANGTGQSEIASGASINLGGAFDTSGTADLIFEYHDLSRGDILISTEIEYDDTPGGIPGDYNNNGQVEQSDLDLVLLNWGKMWPPPIDGWDSDQPTDGTIDQDDLDGVLLNWGNTAAAANTAAVPEPSTFALLGLCLICVAVRRLRSN